MNRNCTTGDFIADWSYVYRVTAVNSDVVRYIPIAGTDKVFTGQIPVDNFKKAGIRMALTQKEITELISELKTVDVKVEYNTLSAKEEIYKNEPEKVAAILVYFWQRRESLGKADRDLMEHILEHLCREIAIVTKKEFSAVKRNIVAVLNQREKITQLPEEKKNKNQRQLTA